MRRVASRGVLEALSTAGTHGLRRLVRLVTRIVSVRPLSRDRGKEEENVVVSLCRRVSSGE